jgi:hypothetical protein
MGVSFGHGLELTYFRVQKQTESGGWINVSSLGKDQKYRLKLKFKNLNSAAFMPPLTEPHAFLELYSIEITDASYARFYSTSSYTGTSYNRGTTNGDKIFPGKTKEFYMYFKWEAPNEVPMPPPPVKILVGLWSAVSKGKPHCIAPPLI